MSGTVRNIVGRLAARRSAATRAQSVRPDESFVFNIVWTGDVFDHLKYFVASQLDHSRARFRFIDNDCAAGQVEQMEDFASRFPDRIVDIFTWPHEGMVGHGVALDEVLDTTDDGEHFALIDPDIRASGPFLADFAARLVAGCAGVTSGRGVWNDSDHIPEGHPGVNGEYFYSTDGFLFGSPHFAVYRRDAVVQVRERWGVGFGSGGPDLGPEAQAQLAAQGHQYMVYDTGKLMNAFLQFDGHKVEHFEHDNLMHVGGVSHFLSPPAYIDDADGNRQPDWVQYAGMETRFAVAQFTGRVMFDLVAGRAAPAVPAGLDDETTTKLRLVRTALVDLVDRYHSVLS